MPASCKGCGAPMLWVTMKRSGKKNPLNEAPDPEKGNIRLVNVPLGDDPIGEALSGAELERARQDGVVLRTSHFVTCPKKGDFRKKPS